MPGPKRGGWYGGIRSLSDLRDRCTIDGDCWIWRGCVTSGGQPSIWLHGGHRLSGGGAVCMLTTGKRSSRGTNWVPTCRNPRCVSPVCVKPMTVLEHRRLQNSAKSAAARAAIAKTRQSQSSITMDDARAIRESEETLKVLSQRYGKSISLISKIRRGLYWKDPMWAQLALRA